MVEKEFNLSESRQIVKQILEIQYIEPNERRIIELVFSNVETQDKEFIKLLKGVGKGRLHNKEDYELFCEDIDKLAEGKLI